MLNLMLLPKLESEYLGHSPVSENSLDLGMACLIDYDVGLDPMNLQTNGQVNSSKFNGDRVMVGCHV